MKKILLFIIILLNIQCVIAQEIVSDADFNKAIKNGDLEYIKTHDVKDINSNMCFLCTAVQYKKGYILDYLLTSKKADANCPKSSLAPTFIAISTNNDQALETLLKAGADPNYKTLFGITLLANAVAENKPYATKLLLDAGADLNTTVLKIPVAEFAFIGATPELQKVIINHQNKDLKNPTDLNKAVEKLNSKPYTRQFYKMIMGENEYNQQFEIVYCDLTNFDKENKETTTAFMVRVQNGVPYVFLNKKYANEPELYLASTLATTPLYIGETKASIVLKLLSLGVGSVVWEELRPDYPNLKETVLTKFNDLLVFALKDSNYDFNILWKLENRFKGSPKTSKRYKNLDLNSYYPYTPSN